MEDPKITTEDLYGSSTSASMPPSPLPAPLPIEETPEIPMDSVPPPAPMPRVSHGSPVIVIILILVLVGAGIFFSGRIRTLFPSITTIITHIPSPTPTSATPTPADPFAGWNPYKISGLSYALPPSVLAPTCDSVACESQGTYLPGGTRFTIASRGPSALVTDANSVQFTNTVATVSGHTATEFSGTFSGRTITGYGFSQMHGFMIVLSPTTSLEVNHFTPTGITADFGGDDALFTQIMSKLDFSATPSQATASGS